MLNRIILVGRLTKDPELKYTQSGIAVCRFTLAVNRPFKNGQGDQEADFINCVAWRKQAENTANFLRKGSLAGIDGRIQTSNFEGQDGKRVFLTEVVTDSVQFLEPKGNRSEQSDSSARHARQDPPPAQNSYENQNATRQQDYSQTSYDEPPDDPDDLPF
ncbi:single-stranded DNA-binding protein 1 [Sporosarcina sp. NCCP-2716]|uniref:single-stranded DNA-binding protein n=1 Tax=Sporosarcina sp. NCCP-2716 TaxID=2943679 RepID=UPI00204045C0|nr:single-stranded DNA-binding protein [Sporosarcina sp. NCCP-2716]GKV70251.1 single-stranded DNA-binding protein 1 [Sporosarcina sp. NCCP-2716]